MDKTEAARKQAEKDATGEQAQRRAKEIATQHARGIEDKKKLRNRVLDLILEAYDLPTARDADPAVPAPADVQLFHECLTLFRPSDLDELVQERNIDDRCGYALCPKPKQGVGAQDSKVWNGKSGKDFALVNKSDLQRWCSDQCKARTLFVRRQLNNEPAWLRSAQNHNVRLLDSVAPGTSNTNVNPPSSVSPSLDAKMQALSLERADLGVSKSSVAAVPLLERESTAAPLPPTISSNELLEGLPTRAHTRADRNSVT